MNNNEMLKKINKHENKDIPELREQLDNIERKKADITQVNSKIWGMGNMGQDVKEAMTGGSVAVVGKDTVLNENIVDKQITINKLDDGLENGIYYKVETSMIFYSRYVDSIGSVINSDGTIKSTEKIKYNNTIKVSFIGDVSDKLYKISYYDYEGNFLESTEYLSCNDFYILKGANCIITVKANPLSDIYPSDFMKIEVLYEKESQNIISPQKLLSKYNILEGLTLYENKNITDRKNLVNYSIEDLLTQSDYAYVYEPIQVRNNGGLIYDKLYLSKTNNSGARQVIEYDINGTYLNTNKYDTTEVDKMLDLNEKTFFIVVIGYYDTQSVADFKLHVGKHNIDWLMDKNAINENSIKAINIDGTYNLLSKLIVYENKTFPLQTSLVDFEVESILQDSSVAFCYSPLQVRDGKGLIYGDLYISTFASTGARQVGLYDKNGKWIGVIESPGEGNEQLLDISDAWYIVVVGYYSYEDKNTFSVHPKKKKIEWLDIGVPENTIEKIETTSKGIYYEKVTPTDETTELLDPYKYPLYPAWGHEYLYSWYEKLFNNEKVVISCDGDSTTEENNSIWTSVNGRRVDMVKKIMCTIGKYPVENITINKNGYGSRTTGTWVGAYFNSDKPNDAINFPNGILDKTMAQNPDLLIWGFGINDASLNLFPNTSIEDRLNQSKAWLEEGLKRIRGNESVNGRPSYNKSAKELAIILCTPIQAENGVGRGRDIWQKYQREMVMEMARKYNCAFYDVSARHWDHSFSGQWSQNNTVTERSYDKLHPMPACNADFMSGMQDLLFPICLWKWE